MSRKKIQTNRMELHCGIREYALAQQGGVTQEPPEKSATGKIDSEELILRVGGDLELLARMVLLFFRELPGYREDIAAAIAVGDRHALRDAAHALRAMLSVFVAHGGHETVMRLESIGIGGELAGAQAVLVELDLELATIRPLLAGYLTPSNS